MKNDEPKSGHLKMEVLIMSWGKSWNSMVYPQATFDDTFDDWVILVIFVLKKPPQWPSDF